MKCTVTVDLFLYDLILAPISDLLIMILSTSSRRAWWEIFFFPLTHFRWRRTPELGSRVVQWWYRFRAYRYRGDAHSIRYSSVVSFTKRRMVIARYVGVSLIIIYHELWHLYSREIPMTRGDTACSAATPVKERCILYSLILSREYAFPAGEPHIGLPFWDQVAGRTVPAIDCLFYSYHSQRVVKTISSSCGGRVGIKFLLRTSGHLLMRGWYYWQCLW
jgi:hypothetical protein